MGFTKKALRRKPGYPIGVKAPMYIECCSSEIDLPDDPKTPAVCPTCKTIYDHEGWLQEADKYGPVRTLQCCCCGAPTRGRQWWNRDKGYGLCAGCIDVCRKGFIRADHMTDEEADQEMHRSYGVRGIHYDIEK